MLSRLTYANVASSLALFVALGGTSYAVAKLPRDSVGSKQIRTGAVRSSELRTSSVRSGEIKNGAIRLRDIRGAARAALKGQVGPPGPPGAPSVSYFLVADSAGGTAAGNGGVIAHQAPNAYIVHFPRSVATCALVSSPARVPSDAPPSDPPAGSTVIVAHEGTNALVRTFDNNNVAKALPFMLIAAC